MVMGGGSRSKGRGFESRHSILSGCIVKAVVLQQNQFYSIGLGDRLIAVALKSCLTAFGGDTIRA